MSAESEDPTPPSPYPLLSLSLEGTIREAVYSMIDPSDLAHALFFFSHSGREALQRIPQHIARHWSAFRGGVAPSATAAHLASHVTAAIAAAEKDGRVYWRQPRPATYATLNAFLRRHDHPSILPHLPPPHIAEREHSHGRTLRVAHAVSAVTAAIPSMGIIVNTVDLHRVVEETTRYHERLLRIVA